MGNRKLKPVTPGQRFVIISDNADLTTDKPEKSLLATLKKHSGRNNTGRVTCRHKGGGSRRAYRVIDFHRDKLNVPGTVKTIEYDPNRNVRISLVCYADGEKRYILAPQELKVGATIVSGPESEVKAGNALPLENIQLGTKVHKIELVHGKRRFSYAEAPAQALSLWLRKGDYITLKLSKAGNENGFAENATQLSARSEILIIKNQKTW